MQIESDCKGYYIRFLNHVHRGGEKAAHGNTTNSHIHARPRAHSLSPSAHISVFTDNKNNTNQMTMQVI